MKIPRQCEVCGGMLRLDNKYGICIRNPVCSAENSRRRKKELYRVTETAEVTYLLWSPELRLYKIGHTINIKHRLSILKTGLPYPASLLATFPVGRELECFLHEVFADLRVGNSEWFRLPINPEVAGATIWEFARVYWEQKGQSPPSKFSIFSSTGDLAA